MHELNICYSIIKELEQQAQFNHVNTVKALWLEVGELAGIELDALEFSFPIAAKNSIAEQAKLIIKQIPGQAFCQSCDQTFSLKNLFSPCPNCKKYVYDIIQGKELKIIKMEVD